METSAGSLPAPSPDEEEVLDRCSELIFRLALPARTAAGEAEDSRIRRELRLAARSLGKEAAEELRPALPYGDSLNRVLKRRAETEQKIREKALAPDKEAWVDLKALSVEEGRLEQELAYLRRSRAESLKAGLLPRLSSLAGELGALARTYFDTSNRLKSFFGRTEALWDLEPGEWREVSWKGAEEAERFLAAFPQLRDLADRVGRRRDRSEQSAASKKILRRETWTEEEETGRSEIRGYTQGRDLETLAPFEYAYLLEPATEGLFYKRHAEGRLVTLDYVTRQNLERSRVFEENAPPETGGLSEGPVVLAVDTSGSMTGVPEAAAKAMTLALCRLVFETRRPLYLIAFSDRIETLEPLADGKNLAQVVRFLSHSFRGGTDLRPALAHSLALLSRGPWIQADLLIVSDFRVPKIMIKKAGLIDKVRKEKGARLHALSITAFKPSDDLHIFDSAWHFRIDARGGAAGLDGSLFKEVLP